MAAPNAPIVLQLAPLPRTQIGPFLILGVDKDANRETIEAAWAEKIKQARRGQVKTSLDHGQPFASRPRARVRTGILERDEQTAPFDANREAHDAAVP